MKATMPKWATSERLELLDRILHSGRCAQGEDNCPVLAWRTAQVERLIGAPQGNPMLWAARAAVAIDRLNKEMPWHYRDHVPNEFYKELIRDWKAQDREEAAMLRAEAKRAFTSPDMTGWGQVLDASRPSDHFDPVDRDAFFAHQPEFYPVREGVSGITFKRFVEVRPSSGRTQLMVEVAIPKKPLTRNQRRRRAQGKGRWAGTIEQQCLAAVKDYQASR